MKILVTGFTGQLGFDIVKEGLELGYDMVGVGSKDLDVTKQEHVSRFVSRANPDIIIHCAAYTAVDNAEDDNDSCWDINVEGTRNLALAAKEIKAKLIYISTDYVFSGEGEIPFTEADSPSPNGYYGLTKLEGEKVVKEVLDKWFIVRISWVFGINGNNFIKTMLRLAEERNEINVVGDQYGSPTYTKDLAGLLLKMSQSDKYGIYHASNEGFCTWSEFAVEIFKQAGKNIKVNSITTDEYPTRAVRPKNSRLSKQKLKENGFYLLPNWQDALKRYLEELTKEVK